MPAPIRVMILQTRHIESISLLTAELVKAFPAPDYEVTLVYLEKGEPSESDKYAAGCHFLGLDKTAYKGLRLAAKRRLQLFLAQHQFDVVIANMYKPTQLLMQLGVAVSARVCIGIIHAFGEFDRPLRRWSWRWMLTPRWTIVGVSAAVRDYLIQAGCGLQLHNTRAINNAVDVAALVAQALPKQAARAALDLPQTGIIFGTVGRCVKGKRHLELVQAFEQFSRTNPDAYLVIIGDGELRPALVQYVDEHKLASKVLLIGRVDNAARFMRALDVFVFPSESEGFGLALLEAMAASVPAIVHQVEPLNSIVSGCGLSVDCTQPDRLLEALQHCYELAPYARQQMGVAHYARAQAQYDIALYHRAYRDLVEQLLSAQPEA